MSMCCAGTVKVMASPECERLELFIPKNIKYIVGVSWPDGKEVMICEYLFDADVRMVLTPADTVLGFR